MESYLKHNFGNAKSKNSSEEALQRWRKLCGIVKNPKQRFHFTANLSKHYEAEAMRRTNQPLPETVALVEDIVVEYVTDLVHKGQDIATKRGKLLTEDFFF